MRHLHAGYDGRVENDGGAGLCVRIEPTNNRLLGRGELKKAKSVKIYRAWRSGVFSH